MVYTTVFWQETYFGWRKILHYAFYLAWVFFFFLNFLFPAFSFALNTFAPCFLFLLLCSWRSSASSSSPSRLSLNGFSSSELRIKSSTTSSSNAVVSFVCFMFFFFSLFCCLISQTKMLDQIKMISFVLTRNKSQTYISVDLGVD